jgi:hypothetical protein
MYTGTPVMVQVAKQLRQDQVERARLFRRGRAASRSQQRAARRPSAQLDVSLARNSSSTPVWLRRSRKA